MDPATRHWLSTFDKGLALLGNEEYFSDEFFLAAAEKLRVRCKINQERILDAYEADEQAVKEMSQAGKGQGKGKARAEEESVVPDSEESDSSDSESSGGEELNVRRVMWRSQKLSPTARIGGHRRGGG